MHVMHSDTLGTPVEAPRLRAEIWRTVTVWRSQLIIFLTPLLSLPLPLVVNTKQGKCAYTLLLMAVYWVTEALPVSVTALLPMFLFPMMGVMDAKNVAKPYFNHILVLLLGGMLVAVAIERWNLHHRIALRIMMLMGSEPKWLMMGLMLATWLLSMWISNSAATAVMVPITESILFQLRAVLQHAAEQEQQQEGQDVDPPPAGGQEDRLQGNTGSSSQEESDTYIKRICRGMLLAVCYGANCGGIATLPGTPPNLVLMDSADKLYADYGLKSPLTFVVWSGFALPLSTITVAACWAWLQFAFFRNALQFPGEDKATREERVKGILKNEYSSLGPLSFPEGSVLAWFLIVIVLWITRDFGSAGGWGDIFGEKMLTDSTPAIFVGVILFIFPSHSPFKMTGSTKPVRPLLKWADAHAKLPWSMFLLLGGGFALSQGCQESGLSTWMGEQLAIKGVNKWGMLVILCFVTASLTEVTSNAAVAILFVPIVRNLALSTGVHPLCYMFPTTLAASYGFMLPSATPPNAIIFAPGHVRVFDMMWAGIVMKIIAVLLLVLASATWGNSMFNFDDVPAPFLNASLASAAGT